MNEVKVLLLGDGKAGKTTLAYRLAFPEKDPPTKEERTRGIDVHPWHYSYKKKDYRVNLWDFGGQTIYFAVHQYFFSGRALYLYIDSSRSGTSDAYDPQRDWSMQSAEIFGNNSPMLFIQNRYDTSKKNIPYDKLRELYPFLASNHYHADFLKRKNLEEVKSVIKRKVAELPSVGVVMPKKWLRVREAIGNLTEGKGEDLCSFDDFADLCKAEGITGEKSHRLLAQFFHQLGIFLYYHDVRFAGMEELIILNRNWATKATYEVFDDEKIQKNDGQFNNTDIRRLWKDKQFKTHKPMILQLMGIFGIAFQIDSTEQRYIIPIMREEMPLADREKAVVGTAKPFNYFFEYSFMPIGIINQLSVRLKDRIAGEDKENVWKNAVIIQTVDEQTKAIIEEVRERNQQKLEITVYGPDVPALAEAIDSALSSVHKTMNQAKLNVDAKIPCICNDCQKADADKKHYYPYQKIKEQLFNPQRKKNTRECQNSQEDINIFELMHRIAPKMSREAREKEEQFKKEKSPELFAKAHRRKQEEEREFIEESLTAQTKEIKSEVLDKILPAVRAAIDESDKKLLTKILPKLEEAELHREHTNNLIEMVDKAMREIYQSQVANFSVNKNVENACRQVQKVKTDDSDFVDKLKVTIPLIPFILTYSGELSSPNLLQDVKKMWKEGGWKRLFVEKV